MDKINEEMSFFDDYFSKVKYMDDFGHSSTWNKEINKWLGLIYKIDNKFYENGKNRIKQSNEKRDQFLGEVFSIFYFHEIFNAKNFKIEPSGCGNKKLDFSCECFNNRKWFIEVKSPTWKGEIQKNTSLTKEQRNIRCKNQQYINGESHSFTPKDAIEDSIKNSLGKFEKNKNNVLVIIPNMCVPVLHAPRWVLKNIIKKEIFEQDKNHLLSKVIIIEHLLREKFEYLYFNFNC